MLTRMTEDNWAIVLDVFDASQTRSGEPGRDDRKFREAVHYFSGNRDNGPAASDLLHDLQR